MRHGWPANGVLIAALAAQAAGLSGCGGANRGGAPADPARSGGDAPAVAEATAGSPVTDEECRAFAATVEEAVRAGDAAAFFALIDWDAILGAATAGIAVPEASRKGFMEGVKTSMRREQGLVPQIVGTVKEGGSYKFLHAGARDEHKTALFRLVMPDSSGVNYHDFVLARRPGGEVRAVDVSIFLAGEPLSRTMRRMYIPVAAQVSRGLLDRLPPTEREFARNLPGFQKMTDEVRNGRPGGALAIFERFPPELKKDKNVLMLRLQAAQDVNDREYSRAIADFRAAHPEDAGIDMISFHDYLLKKDYPRAIACLDRIDGAVGGDPYIHVMRASIHTDEGRYEVARQDARRALAEDPTLQDAYWTLLTISLEERNFADTVTLLDQLEGRFRIPFGDMTLLPIFAGFVQSPEYRAWKQRPKPAAEETARSRGARR